MLYISQEVLLPTVYWPKFVKFRSWLRDYDQNGRPHHKQALESSRVANHSLLPQVDRQGFRLFYDGSLLRAGLDAGGRRSTAELDKRQNPTRLERLPVRDLFADFRGRMEPVP